MTVNYLRKTKHDNKQFVELLVIIAMRSMMEKNNTDDKDAGDEDNISSMIKPIIASHLNLELIFPQIDSTPHLIDDFSIVVSCCHWQPVALALFKEDEFIITNNILDDTLMDLHCLK